MRFSWLRFSKSACGNDSEFVAFLLQEIQESVAEWLSKPGFSSCRCSFHLVHDFSEPPPAHRQAREVLELKPAQPGARCPEARCS